MFLIKFLVNVLLFGLLFRLLRSLFTRPESTGRAREGASRAAGTNPDRPMGEAEFDAEKRPAPRIQPHDVIDVPFEDVPREEARSGR